MKKTRNQSSILFAACIAAALCALTLAFICADSEKYSDDCVPASISYTPPEKISDEGFWEIFSDAVVRLLKIEK